MGDGFTEEEQMKAPKGTLFIPYSQFPPKKHRKDCSYHYTPSMLTPTSIENVHSCEVKFLYLQNTNKLFMVSNNCFS